MGESLSKLHQVEREILVADLADELVIHVGVEVRNQPALQHSQPSVKPRSLDKNPEACN